MLYKTTDALCWCSVKYRLCPFLIYATTAHKEEQKSKVADRKRKQQVAADEVSEAKRSSEDTSQTSNGTTVNEAQAATPQADSGDTTAVQGADSEMDVDITTEPDSASWWRRSLSSQW